MPRSVRKALGALRAHQSACGAVVRALPAATGDRCDVFASELVNENQMRPCILHEDRLAIFADIDSSAPGWDRLEERPSRGRSRACRCSVSVSASHRGWPHPRCFGLTFPRTRGVVSRCHSAGRSCARVTTRRTARPSLRRRPSALDFRGRPEPSRHSFSSAFRRSRLAVVRSPRFASTAELSRCDES
jgi:hypothetical protein